MPPRQEQTLSVLKSDRLQLYLQDFLLDCQARALSKHTIRNYRNYLNAFVNHLREQGISDIDEIRPAHIRAWLAGIAATHNPGGTHGYYRPAKTWLRWLVDQGELDRNPMEKIKAPRLDEAPLDPIPIQHIQAMLKGCDKSEMGTRDRAIIFTLLDTGVRAGELVALNIGDVDISGGTVQVRKSKSHKPRLAFMGYQTRRAILAYQRQRDPGHPDEPLFLTVREDGIGGKKRLTYWGLRQIMVRVAGRAGVPVPGIHAFRRTFAITSLRNGADPVSISRMLGHGSLPVVLRYLKQLAQDLGDVHRQSSPVDNLKL